MNFLIVEDDNIQLTGLKHIIEEEYADAVVNTASTYNDAITIIDSFDIDIFLLDIDLGGGKTGLDVCGYLRRIPKYNDTPVIFITDITVPNLDVINKYHCQYYFLKPYDRIDVVGGINSVLTQPDDQTSRIRVKDIQGILFHISMDEIIYVYASGTTSTFSHPTAILSSPTRPSSQFCRLLVMYLWSDATKTITSIPTTYRATTDPIHL